MKMTVENALLYLRGLCLAKPKLLGVAVGDCCTPYFVLYHRTCARYLTWYDVAVQRVRTPKRTNERTKRRCWSFGFCIIIGFHLIDIETTLLGVHHQFVWYSRNKRCGRVETVAMMEKMRMTGGSSIYC